MMEKIVKKIRTKLTLRKAYTPKQRKVLNIAMSDDFRTLILDGAVRTGKTVVNNDVFIHDVLRVSRIAQENNDFSPQYILAGYSSKTLDNNVINELTKKYGWEPKYDKHGSFKLFGVKIVVAFTNSERGVGAVRGMTAYGAYINEASLANRAVFDEILSRVSMPNSHILLDTNPDSPTHWLKKEYIDNKNPEAGIKRVHFVLDDNTFLSSDYVKHLKAETPTGMYYDRKILGLWVNGEGAVYRDFDEKKHFVTNDEVPELTNYFAGVDWGYEHSGVIQVWGETDDHKYYLVEEHAAQHEEIDYWVDIALDVKKRYGDIPFWCDSARPEHVARFINEDLDARNADKKIMKGVEDVAKMIKANRLFVVRAAAKEFESEIFDYVWDEKKGVPVKENDHAMDTTRYAIHNHISNDNEVEIFGGIF